MMVTTVPREAQSREELTELINQSLKRHTGPAGQALSGLLATNSLELMDEGMVNLATVMSMAPNTSTQSMYRAVYLDLIHWIPPHQGSSSLVWSFGCGVRRASIIKMGTLYFGDLRFLVQGNVSYALNHTPLYTLADERQRNDDFMMKMSFSALPLHDRERFPLPLLKESVQRGKHLSQQDHDRARQCLREGIQRPYFAEGLGKMLGQYIGLPVIVEEVDLGPHQAARRHQ